MLVVIGLLVVVCWWLFVGGLFVVGFGGCWWLVVDGWLLVVGSWLFVVGCWWLVVSG